MSRRKKIVYLGIIGVGGVALAVDRLLFSGGVPATVEAAVFAVPQSDASAGRAPGAAESSGVPQPVAKEPAATPGNVLIPEIPFPRGVTEWVPQAGIRDLFRPVFREDGVDEGDPVRGGDRRDPKRASAKAVFVGGHTLQAVLTQPGFQVAVVDASWLRIGDSLDGCTLSEIQGTMASFRCPDGEAVLSIRGDPLHGGDKPTSDR